MLGGRFVVAKFIDGRIEFMSADAFKRLYSNQKIGGERLGRWWLNHPARRTYPDGAEFNPGGNIRPGRLNLWIGFALEPDPTKDCSLIVGHIRDVVCNGDAKLFDYVISWLAHIVQHPGEKPGVALVLVGEKGAGKDTVVEVLRRIVGTAHCAHAPSMHRLTDNFNRPFATALIGHVEEATWGGDHKGKGLLQSLITAPTMPLEIKGVDTTSVDSFPRLILTTNEFHAIPATPGERRYAILSVSDARCNDRAYFDALYAEILGDGCAGFMAFLQNWKTPSDIDLRTPPGTAALMAQKLAHLRGVGA